VVILKGGIKNFSFSEIMDKASKIRSVINRISWSSWDLEDLDYKFLVSHEYAPLIATICDEGINADDAWGYPEWLYNKVGTFDPEVLLKQDHRKLLEEYLKDKWPKRFKKKDKENYLEKISRSIKEALDLFLREGKSPVTMFDNRKYRALEVYFMLRRIPGIGPKKANMVTRDFIYRSLGLTGRNPWFDQIRQKSPKFKVVDERFLDMPIDVHVVKVFNRIFGRLRPYKKYKSWRNELQNHVLDILAFSKLVFPEFPAKLDQILWTVGREYCHNRSPKCSKCPLNEVCEVGKTSSSNLSSLI